MTTAAKPILITTTETAAREVINRILQHAVPAQDYAKGAHRFFQENDAYGDRYRAVSAVIAALAALPSATSGEIAPCPHCGGPGKLISTMGDWLGKGKGVDGGSYGPMRRRVVCASIYTDGAPPCPDSTISEDTETAIAVWNTRPPQAESGEMRVVPRQPTDRDISEILYNINRKRRDTDELTEADVREVMSNYFYNVGRPGPDAAALQGTRLTDILDEARAKVAENPERAAEIRANWTDGLEPQVDEAGEEVYNRVITRLQGLADHPFVGLQECVDLVKALRARSMAPVPPTPEAHEGLIAGCLLDIITSTPDLLSLLYDAGMLPEQITTKRDAIAVAAVCEAYQAGLRAQSLVEGEDNLRVTIEHEACPKCRSVSVEPYWWHRGQAWIIICQDCKHEAGRERDEGTAWSVWDAEALAATKARTTLQAEIEK